MKLLSDLVAFVYLTAVKPCSRTSTYQIIAIHYHLYHQHNLHPLQEEVISLRSFYLTVSQPIAFCTWKLLISPPHCTVISRHASPLLVSITFFWLIIICTHNVTCQSPFWTMELLVNHLPVATASYPWHSGLCKAQYAASALLLSLVLDELLSSAHCYMMVIMQSLMCNKV